MTLAIGDTTVGLAYPWTSAQACGFISATILERGTTMMMIKPFYCYLEDEESLGRRR